MSKDQWFGDKTYSQHGEDLFFLNAFSLMNIIQPRYLDIGAHHPTEISNTALLNKFGSRGINVEANPYLLKHFEKERPLDLNLSVAIGPESGDGLLYLVDRESGRNTLSKIEMDSFVKKYPEFKVTETLVVPIVTLHDIVTNYTNSVFPDLLCVDVEGYDFEVLLSGGFATFHPSCLPKIICVEVRRGDEKRFKDLLEPWFSAATRFGENLVFIRDDYRHIIHS